MQELFLGLIFALGIPHCWCTCIAWKPSSTPPARPAWRGGCQRFSPCRTLTVKATKNLPRMTRSALTNLNSPSSCSCVRHRRCVGSMQRGLRCSWKLPVFQVLVINIFYSHCCFEKPFSQVLLHLHDDLYELSIWHLWEGIGMRGGHQDHSWSPKWKSQVII